MKANEAPERIWMDSEWVPHFTENSIEYIRKDAFIEKVRKWFEKQPETYDANGVRCYGTEDFEDFRKYMEE